MCRKGKYEGNNMSVIFIRDDSDGELSLMTETPTKAPCGQLIPTGFIQTLQIRTL